MNEAANPYSPPRSNVRLPDQPPSPSQLLSEPRSVSAGSAFTWISQGWALMKPDLGMWVLITLAFIIMNILLSFIPFVGSLITNLLSAVFLGGVLMGVKGSEQGQRLQFSSLFAGFSTNFAPLLGLGALSTVMWLLLGLILGLVFWIFLLTLGAGTDAVDLQSSFTGVSISVLTLLALVGGILISMLLWFATPLVALNDVPVFKALGLSFKGCLYNLGPLFLYGLASVGLVFLGALALGVGLLIVFPLLIAAFYKSYQQIFLK